MGSVIRVAWRMGATLVACLLLAGCGDDSDETGATGGASGAAGKGGSGGGAGLPPVDPAEYLDRPLREQVAVMETRQLSSAALTQGYLQRIESRDQGSSGIHAVLALDPSAADDAASLDEKRGGGSPLQGAVILIKDNIDTEGLATTAGSIALANNVPQADAPAIRQIRDARGLVLGKTNLSEWANFRGIASTSGWSSAGGQTLNGADPAYNPCGSSSGSAAAIAAGLASAALGTETDGSIVCPASVNGVVGFKPTVGLVSRTGVVPISHSQDTIGTMTRTVGDAARLLRVIAGPDPQDPATAEIPAGFDRDFETPLETATLSGVRLGVVDSFGGFTAAVRTLFQAELDRIQAAGATLVTVSLPTAAAYSNDEQTTLLHEFKHDLNAYLAAHGQPGQPATLEELIAFNQANQAEVMPYFGQQIFMAAQATTGLTAPEYMVARRRARETTREQGIVAVMTTENLNALISPSTTPAWMTSYATGDPGIGIAAGPAAVAGCPHLSVPMGKINGLPVGLSIFAGPWQDGAVLALGHAYEKLPR